ncbi:MAG: hypothetical protein FH750_12315 [Pseudomonas stutzeri]|nr:hypothetical protein [Stutzerimonas stutzeri]
MTKHDLKELAAMGAELGAAKAENERLREVLSRIANLPMYHCSTENDYRLSAAKAMAVAALSQQAEPTDTFTAVDMATAAAQGFRDGQAAVEQAPAPDEREAPVVVATAILGGIYHGGSGPELGEIDIEVCMPALEALQCETVNGYDDVFLPLMTVAQHERIVAALTRPAQTEQQPVCWASSTALAKLRNGRNYSPCVITDGPAEFNDTPLYAAPIAQTAPRCQCCGYLVTDSEHRGCLRAATPSDVAKRYASAALSAVTAERDRLLSDNASLRGSCKALGEENKQLKRENKRQGRTLAAMAAKEA